ncbi:MAG: tRNA (adenosine(37)-N6)-threonylcarbamoyltransferase complex dimerization subunit type 1 TsaB [Geminicoccaceae bacterium]|nr:tRNA (adenosine(37)-N6)-threonylcarbamoyltransferase complex dimerization subunit type 1 TsaB [Geminicoccaceae bacterium]
MFRRLSRFGRSAERLVRVLAFDCCGDAMAAGVGDVDGGQVTMLAEDCSASTARHAERLVPMIVDMVKAAGCGFDAIDLLAVTCGPGSFTGIRTCVAAARGIALAGGIPIMPMTTLEVMAAGRGSGGAFRVIMDGRRNRLFVQDFSDPFTAEGEAASLDHAAFATLRGTGSQRPVLGFGGEPAMMGASAMIRLAAVRMERGAVPIAGTSLLPLYLNPPDARKSAGQSLLHRSA